MSDDARRQPPPVIERFPMIGQTMTVVSTEFGPIAIAEDLVRAFDRDGWPEDSVLKRMADMQPDTTEEP